MPCAESACARTLPPQASLTKERDRLDKERDRNSASAGRLHETRAAARIDGSADRVIQMLQEEARSDATRCDPIRSDAILIRYDRI